MGGGTAGWVAALYLLNKLNDVKIKLISSSNINSIGVGEGTTTYVSSILENVCKIDKKEFLKETKGSFKYGIKFNNWNFDSNYYYHLFSKGTNYDFLNTSTGQDLDYEFVQYAINENFNISQKILQKKFHGSFFDLVENNKISLNINSDYAYHFSATLVIPFLKKKCLQFKNFEFIDDEIKDVNYNEKGFIKSLKLNENEDSFGDFFINCLGFKSINLLSKEYFSIQNWDNYILNNSAFAIQVKNSPTEIIEPYTTATAQEYGWSWKIPQYEKTGYGYVYSDHFINDEDRLYSDLLKTYNIKENNVFKTKVVKSKPYYNDKQIYKNCLSLGLASGFVEPLEATSIHMTVIGLQTFFDLIELENKIELTPKYISIFNDRLKKEWNNIFKFIIYHYFTKNPINDYWQHYKNIEKNNIFNFYEKYENQNRNNFSFSKFSYFSISLGMNKKDFYYNFWQEKYLKKNIYDYLKLESNINCTSLYSHNEVLNEIILSKNNFTYE